MLVLFGGSQIPKLARNLGRAQKEFKDGIDEGSRTAAAPASSPRAANGTVTDTTATDAPTRNDASSPNP